MATIPLLNGGESVGVAETRSPASGSVNLGRFSSGMTSQLSGAAQGFRRQGDSLQGPQMDPNQGQGMANGIRGLARGVGDFSNVMLQLANKKAEAKNYSDVTAARNQMLQIEGEFDQWRLQNPDPEGWESKWGEMSASARGRVTETKGLSPAAIERIGQEFEDFNVRQTINVGTMAVKGHVAKARSAVDANILRAVDAGDLDSVRREVQMAQTQGWMYEDDAVRTIMQAEDAIEAKTLKMLDNKKETALLNGDIESAKAAVSAMPIREDERALEMAVITNRHEYKRTVEDAEDMIALDPEAAARELEGERFAGLRASDRSALQNMAYRSISEDRTATLTGIKDDIKLGAVRSPADLMGRDDFRSLSERQQVEIQEYFKAGAQNDVSEFLTLKRSLSSYNPANDPRGAEKEQIETLIALRFDGDKAEELFTDLTERAEGRGAPMSASDRVVSDVFSSLQKRYDNGEIGNFKVTGDKITEQTDKDGVTFYTVADPTGEVAGKSPWLSANTPQGRKIELSESDILRLKSGKTSAGDVYDDQKAKNAAFGRFLSVQEQVDQKVKAGELIESDDIIGEVNRLLGGEIEGAFETRAQSDRGGNSLPSGPAGISNGLFNPVDASDFIKNYQIGF